MKIAEVKKELNLKDKDIARLFGLKTANFANSSARARYENAICLFYELIKNYKK